MSGKYASEVCGAFESRDSAEFFEQNDLRGKEDFVNGWIKAGEAKLKDAEKDIDDRVEKRLAAERAKLSKEALAQARSELSLEIQDLQTAGAEKDKKI